MSDRRRVSLVSLGCPKNLVDSEGIVSGILSRDFEVVVDPSEADLVLVNTCGFLASARAESIETIRRAVALKDEGRTKAVFVTGCMVGNYRDKILDAAPGVDRLVEFSEYDRIAGWVEELLPAPEAEPQAFFKPGRWVQARLTPAHFAYLKVSEGCNHTCAFCVIPKIRGRMKSVPLKELVARARRLAQMGVKELNVVAQDSTMYGIDLYARNRTADLMRALGEVDGLRWIRLLYAYPTEVDDDLLRALASGGAILPYLDVPIQHSSGPVLERMRRQSSEARVEDLMVRLRENVPGIAIRTTVIVGFPGETDADFEHLMRFVARHRIDRLGAFTYSPEEGSPAATMTDQVPEEVKAERFARLMTLQREIAEEANRDLVGRTIEVLVENPRDDDGRAVGRSRADAPEIDGAVRLSGRPVAAGELVRARVTAADVYDLEATVCP